MSSSVTHPPAVVHPETERRISSPALLFFGDRISANMRAMLRIVGGDAGRLRPHVKTHKCGAIIRMWADMGVGKHKCATTKEAEVLAQFGATDIMLAFPAVGPTAHGVARLAKAWPEVRFSTVVDSSRGLSDIVAAVQSMGARLGIFIELDVGHGRTGLTDVEQALELARQVVSIPELQLRGLHGYDGHLGAVSTAERPSMALAVRQRLADWRRVFEKSGIPVEALVVAGSPSFPHHALEMLPGMELSPGTVVLHDTGYGKHAELGDFVPAVAVLTRVVGHPGTNRLTFDCGTKAIACDQPAGARLTLQGLEGAKAVIHNEEHLVVETLDTAHWPIGRATLAWPVHACPTSAWHDEALAIDSTGNVAAIWPIEARGRGPRYGAALA